MHFGLGSKPVCSVGSLLVFVLFVSACNETRPPNISDAGVDAGRCLLRNTPIAVFSSESMALAKDSKRRLFVDFDRDACEALDLVLESSREGVIDFPQTLRFESGTSRAFFEIVGKAEGQTTLSARIADVSGPTIELPVLVEALPAITCSGTSTASVEAGGSLAGQDKLQNASLSIPAGASRNDAYRVPPMEVSIACGSNTDLPDDYVALGPAVAFSSPTALRLSREINFRIPLDLGRLPSGRWKRDVEIFYRGPENNGRVVPVASPVFGGPAHDGWLEFQAPRLGSYQAVSRSSELGETTRRLTYRAIAGLSMGAAGAALIAAQHPDRFDAVIPLGGSMDWTYLLEYMRAYHLGGFCTEAQRNANTPGCEASSLSRAPARGLMFEHTQHFENWWYEDGNEGQGGNFRRSDYLNIFRDISTMFGNPNTNTSLTRTMPNVLPPGVPDADRQKPASRRCAEILTIPPFQSGQANTGFFDDEYNPSGSYPVITFCDGNEMENDIGRWNASGTPTASFDVALAVDRNRNGKRDAGEPVIRNMRENFEDTGTDGLRNVDEPGFDAVLNPDPNGDDYDFQYNPTGTENNWDFNEGESFEDFGLDGVEGTKQLDQGGFDSGEGNGRFDRSQAAYQMIRRSLRGQILGGQDADGNIAAPMPQTAFENLHIFTDGGIRDLFNWAVMGQQTMGAFAARQRPMRIFNGYNSIQTFEGTFDAAQLPWHDLPDATFVRYGSIDATDEEIRLGDGGHGGSAPQVQSRLASAFWLANQQWPTGDRNLIDDEFCFEVSNGCVGKHLQNIEFTAPNAMRTGPLSVVLPPGYFKPENANLRYPVVYLLHGYGMEPDDFNVAASLFWLYMRSGTTPQAKRLQKMIIVFPDGACRGNECSRGTFYTDAPSENLGAPRMTQYFLDAMDYVDQNFRTRMPESITISH